MKIMPDTLPWDPADIRYNTIAGYLRQSPYGAIGPALSIPRRDTILGAISPWMVFRQRHPHIGKSYIILSAAPCPFNTGISQPRNAHDSRCQWSRRPHAILVRQSTAALDGLYPGAGAESHSTRPVSLRWRRTMRPRPRSKKCTNNSLLPYSPRDGAYAGSNHNMKASQLLSLPKSTIRRSLINWGCKVP